MYIRCDIEKAGRYKIVTLNVLTIQRKNIILVSYFWLEFVFVIKLPMMHTISPKIWSQL